MAWLGVARQDGFVAGTKRRRFLTKKSGFCWGGGGLVISTGGRSGRPCRGRSSYKVPARAQGGMGDSRWKGLTLISPSRLRAWAMSKLFCIRIRVSIETPKAFSMRSAISGERCARSFSSADSAAQVPPYGARNE